jgi:hypothetical protein
LEANTGKVRETLSQKQNTNRKTGACLKWQSPCLVSVRSWVQPQVWQKKKKNGETIIKLKGLVSLGLSLLLIKLEVSFSHGPGIHLYH